MPLHGFKVVQMGYWTPNRELTPSDHCRLLFSNHLWRYWSSRFGGRRVYRNNGLLTPHLSDHSQSCDFFTSLFRSPRPCYGRIVNHGWEHWPRSAFAQLNRTLSISWWHHRIHIQWIGSALIIPETGWSHEPWTSLYVVRAKENILFIPLLGVSMSMRGSFQTFGWKPVAYWGASEIGHAQLEQEITPVSK
jgi:hypothetical protein